MDNLDDLHNALIKADAAGNTADAKILADHIRSLQQPLRVEGSGQASDEPKPVPMRGVMGDIVHQLGLTARAGITGLSALPNMLGDAANTGINYTTQGINSLAGTNIPKMQMPSNVTQNLMNNAGISQPETPSESRNQNIASAMVSVAPNVALGKLLAGSAKPVSSAIGNALQTAPGMQIMGSGGAALGGSLAAENGAGWKGQLAASLLGGMTGAGLSSGVTSAMRGMGAPSQQQLIANALKNYAENNAPAEVSAATKPRIKLNIDGTTEQIPQAGSQPSINLEPPIRPDVGVKLSSDKQLANIDTMKKIGLNEQRPSAISGDKFTAGQEYETAKLQNQQGLIARTQLGKEQGALKNYAQNIIHDTGATIGTPEAAGQTIRAPLQGLSDHFDNQVKQIYSAADAKAAGAPVVKLDGLGDMLNTNSVFAGKAENSTLRRGIRAYMKEQNISQDGSMQTIDVKTAEGLRQYMNSQWSPQNSGLIGKIKQSLDYDVTKSAGGDIYDQARALHAQRANTLDNPNGIAKLLNTEGPNGINQAIPDEQVGTKLLSMPTGQFSHILDSLKTLPDHLQDQGQQAISEIKASLAKKIYAAGDTGGTQNGASIWNAANVTRELKAQNSKMNLLFTPDEIAKFQTLHDAGHLLQTPMAYKGAAAQGYNYLQSGAIGLPAALSSGLGAYLGGPMGATVGGAAGMGLSGMAKKGIDASMAAKYAELLRNPVPNVGH